MIDWSRVDGVVLDCDGLLADTEPCWFRAEDSIFAEYGRRYGRAEQAELIGTEYRAAAARIAAMLGHPGHAERIADTLLSRVADEIRRGAHPMPGAVALARACAARLPVAVASNSPRPLVELTLAAIGLADLPVVTAADVPRPKPAPDVYAAACARLGVAPGRAVAFEDSPTGARAARAAGMYVVAVPSLPDQEFDADTRVPSLTDPVITDWLALIHSA
ncbi:haloacid dehalogenase [Pilimelia anulata]|uniref:Haloacid dehalogenase n=1 Tax=Pilimelia anulata TaxID=53371 RepID=A0A8J3FDN5_9ACTN|nr:HAD family phosphatase [Pilimelia anulata]GGJ96895.1 haloacid dehalogenase [Pilimelia anulata]